MDPTMAFVKFVLSAMLLVAGVNSVLYPTSHSLPPMLQKIAQEKDLSQFFALIQGNHIARSALMYRELTIFAPTNAAFETYPGSFSDLVLYHLVPRARTTQDLEEESKLECLLEEFPPLWINSDGQTVYVNNAAVLKNSSDYIVRSRLDQYGKSQVLHVIDEVLWPMSATTTSPTAYDFLSLPDRWKLIPYTFNVFFKKLVSTRKQYSFKSERRATFFIPADQLMGRNIASQIDREMLENSMISDKIIFTKTAYEDFAYVTKGSDRDFYTTVEFHGEAIRVTKVSKRNARKIAEKLIAVLQPNIPVQNGVIHVVRDVVGLFERKLTKFPFLSVLSKIETDPNLNITDYLLHITGLDLLIQNERTNYTLFLPTDTAWKKLASLNHFNLSDLDSPLFRARARKILRRHIVVGEFYDLRRLIDVSSNIRGRELVLDVGEQKLLVRVIERKDNAYLRWGSNEISLARPDYECTNGVVHVIDRPLIFNSELKGLIPGDQYNSLLYKTWHLLKKMMH